MIIIRFFFSNFIYKGICCGHSFELHRQVDAIQMSTHNICLYKEVKKKYTGCNLKTTEFLDCALIGVCAVIRSNTVNPITGGFRLFLTFAPTIISCVILDFPCPSMIPGLSFYDSVTA